MTNDKAVKLLHRIADSQFDGIHGDERREALEMAVRALEGDGDAISRQAAMVVFENSGLDDDSKDTVVRVLEQLPSAQPERPEQPESAKEYCAECNHIEMCRWYPYEGCEFRSLPSAQPERKNGEWIHKPDIYLDEQTWECSECGEPWIFIEGTPSENNANFCPNCGADMRREDNGRDEENHNRV